MSARATPAQHTRIKEWQCCFYGAPTNKRPNLPEHVLCGQREREKESVSSAPTCNAGAKSDFYSTAMRELDGALCCLGRRARLAVLQSFNIDLSCAEAPLTRRRREIIALCSGPGRNASDFDLFRHITLTSCFCGLVKGSLTARIQ